MHTPNALTITGKLREGTGEPGDPLTTYIYQRVKPGLGNLPGYALDDRQKRLHVIPADPATAPQLAQRAKMAAAVTAWHTLDAPAKTIWNDNAKPRNLNGQQYFTSQHLRGLVP